MWYLQRVATNLKNTKPAKLTTGPMLAQAIFMMCVAMIFALSLTVVFANPTGAFADDDSENDKYKDYTVTNVDALLGGDKGWNSNLIKEVSPSDLNNTSGESIAAKVGNFLHTLSVMIITVALFGSVARFGGRAACEILGINFFSSDNTMNPTIRAPEGKHQYGLAAFFLTAEERDSKKQLTILQNPRWFSQMAMETIVFLLVALGVSALLSLASGIAIEFLGQADKAFNTDWETKFAEDKAAAEAAAEAANATKKS